MQKEFKQILKDFLLDNGLTQTEFAKKVGVKQSQVSEWLKGKAKPGYDLLKNICLAFDITADFFLGIIDTYWFKQIEISYDNLTFSICFFMLAIIIFQF